MSTHSGNVEREQSTASGGVTRMLGLRPSPDEHGLLAEPTIEIFDIVEGIAMGRGVANPGAPITKQDYYSGNYPRFADFDLRGLPIDLVPSRFEDYLEALIGGAIRMLKPLAQPTRERAFAFLEGTTTVPPSSYKDLLALIAQGGEVKKEISDKRREGNLKWVTDAYKTAFRLDPIGHPAELNSIVYVVKNKGEPRHRFLTFIPPEGCQATFDPAVEWVERMMEVREWNVRYVQNFIMPDEILIGYENAIAEYGVSLVTTPYRTITTPMSGYNPLDSPNAVTLSWQYADSVIQRPNATNLSEIRDSESHLPDMDYLNDRVFTVLTLISNPDMPADLKELKAKEEVLLQSFKGGGSGLINKIMQLFKNGPAEHLLKLTQDIRREVSSSREARILGAVKVLLSGFSPESMNYANWLIVKPDGQLAYLTDALDEYVNIQKERGNEVGAKAGTQEKILMEAWSRAATRDQAMGFVSREGLVTSASELFKPLKLENGGVWNPVGTSIAYNNLAGWLEERTFPAHTPDTAVQMLEAVFGIKVTSQITEGDLIRMIRKAATTVIPIYPNQSTYDLTEFLDEYPQMSRYHGYEGVITLLGDFFATVQAARPKHLAMMTA